ncbi:hypothetical protein BIV57_16630 [Mangrovactinospora gilvigrisea]|uniref:Carbohydrate kinase FGGY N-terminal domain-containing protein n=1 Tax=Mangrovactinospora gilvigrisea TaxID=1428644 RepID=A0A1J7C481_9ACTN|nr:FGGY family carbohydrate kinase [Mangrovactinospora gilvigrisea]OIV36380.1 hypothetical protein BIV57_16630 [Mangrovactinospora gilvigrisea]
MRVAGIDCSARSTRIVVCDADSGEILRRARAVHPAPADPGALPVELEADPESWLLSLGEAASGGLLEDVDAIGVAAQAHGMVPLDGNGELVRPALLQQDCRDEEAAAELLAELGGPAAWARELGTVPAAGWPIAKLRWLAANEPAAADRVEQVLCPHDWINWQLTGRPRRCTTDRGDASGTGYWSPVTGTYRADLLELALGHETVVPHVLGPAEAAGRTPDGLLVSAGTGEPMATALGLGLRPGDAVATLAGGGAVFAVHDAVPAVPAAPAGVPTPGKRTPGEPGAPGDVTVLADAMGQHLVLAETRTAALTLLSTAALLGTDLPGLAALAERSEPGACGLVMRPAAEPDEAGGPCGAAGGDLLCDTGALSGMRPDNMRPEHVARAAVEGVLCGLADALDGIRASGVEVRRVVLLGAAARWPLVRATAPGLFAAPVLVPAGDAADYAARGAARQAAWALHGPRTAAPAWQPPEEAARPAIELRRRGGRADADATVVRDQWTRSAVA